MLCIFIFIFLYERKADKITQKLPFSLIFLLWDFSIFYFILDIFLCNFLKQNKNSLNYNHDNIIYYIIQRAPQQQRLFHIFLGTSEVIFNLHHLSIPKITTLSPPSTHPFSLLLFFYVMLNDDFFYNFCFFGRSLLFFSSSL